MKRCEICKTDFELHSDYANHIRWKHKDNSDYIKKAREAANKSFENRAGNLITETTKCANCEKEIQISYRPNAGKKHKHRKKDKYYCSTKCSHSRVISVEMRNAISKKAKELWKNPDYVEKVITNNVIKQKRFSSKGEEELRLEINKIFDNKFTFGGCLKLKDGVLIARDCYSNELKVCIEYDGISHFKDIWGQLKNKQLKDKLLKDWCEKNNYQLIRVKEDVYKVDKLKVISYITSIIKNRTELYVELY
jgi:hypothetical protein